MKLQAKINLYGNQYEQNRRRYVEQLKLKLI